MKKITTFLTVVMALLFISSYAQDIDGRILYHNSDGAPLQGVQLELYNADGNYIATTTTNEDGDYSFSDLPMGDYTLEPSYDAQAGGITMGDATLIMLNLVGVYDFSPVEKLAADVNADNKVTWKDYKFIIIDHFIFGRDFPAGDWVFTDISATVGTKGETDNNEDYGSSAGDVQGSWETGQRDERFVEANHRNYKLLSEVPANVDITMNKNIEISGAGLVINYPSSAINVLNATSPLNGAEIVVNNGEIRMAWSAQTPELMNLDKNSTLLELEVEATNEINKPAKFILSDETHFAGQQGAIVKDAAIELPAISLNENSVTVNGVYPNPVGSVSQLDFSLAKAANVKVTLMDISGKTVRVVANRNFAEGNNNISISKGDLPQGIYIYKFYLNNKEMDASGKVIMTD